MVLEGSEVEGGERVKNVRTRGKVKWGKKGGKDEARKNKMQKKICE